MAKTDIEAKKCKTEPFRAAFAHVLKPHTGFDGQEAKYSITMLFDKNVDLKSMKSAVIAAATEKWGDKSKWPKGLRLPFRDGDEKSDLQGYAGTTYVTASSKQAPQVINRKGEVIFSDTEFYSGCYAKASLIAFAYDKAGNKGISFSLQNILKLEDGDAFSGRRKATDDFSGDLETGGGTETTEDTSDLDDLMG